MAAKNPDILQWKSGCCGCLQKWCKLCLWYCGGTSSYSKSNSHASKEWMVTLVNQTRSKVIVQCCAVPCGITPDSGRRRMQCFCIFVRIVTPVLPESCCLVLGVRPPEWLLWLWALQWVFVIHLEWIWSLKHSTPSRNRIDITAIFIFIRRPISPVSLTTAKQYIGAYTDLHKKSG